MIEVLSTRMATDQSLTIKITLSQGLLMPLLKISSSNGERLSFLAAALLKYLKIYQRKVKAEEIIAIRTATVNFI
jgi:hypothetical protein